MSGAARVPTLPYDIGEEIRTQDNLATGYPLFAVQERERIWHVSGDGNWSGYTWHDCDDDYREANAEEAARLDALVEDYEDIPGGWVRTYYLDRWRFVTACFTRKGCEAYIKANGHNLSDPRIYVYSAHRNSEWCHLRADLSGEAEL